MEFPIDFLMDENGCYDYLLKTIHGGKLKCPRCGNLEVKQHSAQRRLPQYRCVTCNQYFNLFTGTALEGTHHSCCKVVLILRGFAKGESTASMSRELQVDRMNLLELRHKLQGNAFDNRAQEPLADTATESDEMYQNAGEKGLVHSNPDDPPRRRANKKKG